MGINENRPSDCLISVLHHQQMTISEYIPFFDNGKSLVTLFCGFSLNVGFCMLVFVPALHTGLVVSNNNVFISRYEIGIFI